MPAPQRVAVLELLACQAASSLENAQLYANLVQETRESKRPEEALRDADRRKDEFLAMLAHELRNPLAPISAAAHLLSLVGKTAHALRDAWGTVGAKHMTTLLSSW